MIESDAGACLSPFAPGANGLGLSPIAPSTIGLGPPLMASAAVSGGLVTWRRDQRGVVMMEFLIALVPVMLAFLGFTQFCFAGIAKLTVRHAAALVARAAVVVLEESEDVAGAPDNIYSGFKAGGLEVARPSASQAGSGPSVQQSQNQVSNVTSAGSADKSASQNMQDLLGSLDRTSSRIKQIRTAAYVPLLAISPSLIQDGVQLIDDIASGQIFAKTTVKDAIGPAGLDRVAGALL
ncbi:MAG TPA: hypothetical protein VHZ95_15360, partial [Polyangiales bacterium]|nr:hypothetical protein [Polyangiales bacterium]